MVGGLTSDSDLSAPGAVSDIVGKPRNHFQPAPHPATGNAGRTTGIG